MRQRAISKPINPVKSVTTPTSDTTNAPTSGGTEKKRVIMDPIMPEDV
jgi:hypothetical protein